MASAQYCLTVFSPSTLPSQEGEDRQVNKNKMSLSRGKTLKICDYCKKQFAVRNSYLKHRAKIGKIVGKFCSNTCKFQANIGKKLSDEHRQKLILAHTGVRLSSEHIKARSLGQSGERHWNWKGGVAQYKSIYQARRIARRNANGGSHTVGEWDRLKAQYNWKCPSCHRQEPEIKLTKDHIVAIAKGGSDNIENIQPLCGPCNVKKSIKSVKYELVEITKNQ